MNVLEFTLEPGERVDVFLSREYPQQSRSRIQKLIEEGALSMEGKTILRPSYKSKKSEAGRFEYPEEKIFILRPSPDKVPVIFENDHFAIVKKPAGMTTHPGAGTGEDTLVHALMGSVDSLSDGLTRERPGIIHRLDRSTEGLMVIAKTNEAHKKIAALFKEKKITKKYRAIVWGFLPEGDWIPVEGYIFRHPKDRKKMAFSTEKKSRFSRLALHDFRIIRSGEIFTQVEIRLLTGRTHQIRAFFTSMGHPIVGDTIYSVPEKRKNIYKEKLAARKFPLDIESLYLRAYYLEFVSPFDGQRQRFRIPMDDWDNLSMM